MKKKTFLRQPKKTTLHTAMLLTLLAPTFLSTSVVWSEDNTPVAEQTAPSQAQESAKTTFESSETLASAVPEDSSTTVASEESNTTTESTIAETATAVITPKAENITITDPILKQEILSTLGLPAGTELTQADMMQLTALSLNSTQLSSLSGLEKAINLTSIQINATNSITDFSPLEQLASLNFVTLQTKSLTSTNFPDLSKNTGLTNLHLGSTSIDNDVLPKIAQLTSLTRIYMDSNMSITTLAPLQVLPNLRSLSAQFCGITDFTVINNFPALNDLAAYGQNTGRNDSPTTIGRSSLSYDFDQQTLFLPFSMMPNRMTNFDGYVPPFTTSTSASSTYLDFNGAQLPASRLQITDLGITILDVSEDEFKNLSSFKYNGRLNNPAGSYAQPAGFSFYAISSGTYLHQFNIVDDGQPVTIYYQDTEGNELQPSETRSGLVGQAFEITLPTISGYELQETIGNPSGIFTDQKQIVTFIYKKIPAPIIELTGKVITHYIDTTNNAIIEPIEQEGTVGTAFTTEKLTFKGYTFKEIQGNPSSLYTEGTQEVTYVYTKSVDKTEASTSTEASETNESTANKTTGHSVTQVSGSSTSNSHLPKTGVKAHKQFPKTGEQSSFTWLFLGLLLLSFINYHYIVKKVTHEK